ncbi:Major Facilitator Superfamily protein [Paenibacillus konkukensis]|uniref:Major Facilitator Superfamily protein n=2 Tax=Paenibacillus konkukensis TaxID=2020716 RepID=A0ABY4RVK2_9BACL|nr:Major Facilitator Superfamily protein [Paenibacillus konkukensis]
MITRLITGGRQWYVARKRFLPEDKRLSKDAMVSLFIHFCFQFGASMSGIFLTLYLWRLTESLWINGMYYIVNYAAAPLAFALGGLIIKRKDRMVTYRLGIGLIALFYLVVVFAQEAVVDYYVLFAIFGGVAGSFYWAGYLTLMYDVSTERNRIRYLAINMMVFTLAGLIGPALAGFIIRENEGLQGYTIVFSIAFFMFLIATLGSFKIKTKASHHKAYYLKFVGLLMNKNKRWFKSLLGFLTMGLFQGIMLFLPNILLFQIVGREDLVGYLGVLYATLSILTGIVLTKYGREERARKFLVISTIGYVAGTLFILWKLTLVTVVAFMVLYSICSPLQGNTITSFYFRLIGALPLKGQLRVESVVMRETFLNCGRVISILALILITEYSGNELLPWVLFAASITQIGIVWLLERVPEESEEKEAA